MISLGTRILLCCHVQRSSHIGVEIVINKTWIKIARSRKSKFRKRALTWGLKDDVMLGWCYVGIICPYHHSTIGCCSTSAMNFTSMAPHLCWAILAKWMVLNVSIVHFARVNVRMFFSLWIWNNVHYNRQHAYWPITWGLTPVTKVTPATMSRYQESTCEDSHDKYRTARCEIGAMITCFVMLCHLEIEVLFHS